MININTTNFSVFKNTFVYNLIFLASLCSIVHGQEALFIDQQEAEEQHERYIQQVSSTPLIPKSRNLLFPREAHNGAKWEQDYNRSQQTYMALDSTKAKMISFNQDKLYPFDYAGTCSAMALDFLARYYVMAGESTDGAKIKSKLKLLKPYYRANCWEFSSRQAAFNTIEILPEYRDASLKAQEKLKAAKMQSLAQYHNIKLQAATKSFPMSSIYAGVIDFASIINNLAPGPYVIRMLCPTTINEKMEQYGHTMIMVKLPSVVFFYDNSSGAWEFTENLGAEVTNYLTTRWPFIPEIRLYHAQMSNGTVKNVSTETAN
jgi:hypothetical protein